MKLPARVLLAMLVLGCNGSSGSKANGGAGGARTGGAGGAGLTVASCWYDGVEYPVGTSFPMAGCNSCSCSSHGPVCTFHACLPDSGADEGPAGGCALAQSYQYGPIGGNSPYSTYAVLTPPTSYAFVRMAGQRANTADVSCAPALPACNSADLIDAADLLADLARADVMSAVAQATPPSYGRDDRPVDGTMFQFLGRDGRGFLVGGACPTADSACVPPPDGVAKLVADLRALDTQQLKDPSCAALQ